MRFTPKSELDRRVQKFQGLLRENEVDGAIIVQSADLFYFAGTVQQSHLFIPAAGNPVLMVRKSFERARRESALDNVVPLDNLKDLPGLVNSNAGSPVKRLGFELDVLPANLYLRYGKTFKNMELVDISRWIRTVRAIKSPYEIEVIREAAKLNQVLFSGVADFLHEGVTEVELAGKLEALYRKNGHQCLVRTRAFNSEMAYGHLMSGPNLGVPSASLGPTGGSGLNPSLPQGAGNRVIGRDEPVMVDYVGVIDGYMVDQTRIFCLGVLPGWMTDAHKVALEIQEMVMAEAKPGVVCGDLYSRALQVAANSSFGEHFMGYPEPVPFIGHGLGIELDELPVIARGVDSPLEEGMVFALEPKFVFPEGAVGVENTFAVTPSGLENLTVFEEEIIYLK